MSLLENHTPLCASGFSEWAIVRNIIFPWVLFAVALLMNSAFGQGKAPNYKCAVTCLKAHEARCLIGNFPDVILLQRTSCHFFLAHNEITIFMQIHSNIRFFRIHRTCMRRCSFRGHRDHLIFFLSLPFDTSFTFPYLFYCFIHTQTQQ